MTKNAFDKCGKVVSVVIPVSNRPSELKRAITSVVNQAYLSIEVIVVCNNTTYPSEIEDVCDIFDNVYFYYLDDCINANVARNYGVKKSSGSYIAFLDSDDEWEKEHISRCLKVISSFDVDFVYGATKIFDGSVYKVKRTRDIRPAEEPIDFLLGFKRGYAQTSSYFMKRECFKYVSWDESLKRHQDYDFFIKMCGSFKCKANLESDTVINWIKGEERSFDYKSVDLFLRRYKSTMSASTRVRYHLMMSYVSLRIKRIDMLFYFFISFFKK